MDALKPMLPVHMGQVMEFRLTPEHFKEMAVLRQPPVLTLLNGDKKKAEQRRQEAINEFWVRIGNASGFDYRTVRDSPGLEGVPGWFIARLLLKGGEDVAVEKRNEPSDGIAEHQDGSESGQAGQTGRGDSGEHQGPEQR